MTGPIVLAGALDTKGEEYAFVRDRLTAAGLDVLLLDVGVLGEPTARADVDRRAIAAAGGSDLVGLAASQDRNDAVEAMARGAAAVLDGLRRDRGVGGLLVLGGSNAAFLMSRLAPGLPLGVPKLLVSTVVAGDTRPIVGTSDLTLMYPVEDIAGLNSVSTGVLARAADALAGMARGAPVPRAADRPAVGCSMFGVTTTCVTALHDRLVDEGREVHVFHANGTGGRTLESMIRAGAFAAVADLTTTELADELLGGVCSAGPDRLTAAAECGVPQVVSVGAMDMVNFGPRDTVPERFRDRLLLAHNPVITLMRTDEDECARLGAILAEKVNRAIGRVEVHLPAKGLSQVSVPGAPFHDPAADAALIDSVRAGLRPDVPVTVHDLGLDDPRFAEQVHLALDRALATKETP